VSVRRRRGAFPYSVSVFPLKLTAAVLWERWIRRSTRGPEEPHYEESEVRARSNSLMMPEGEWRDGISPSRSLRTVREPLDSYGSHDLTVA
jgi:hypothetical protein